MPASGTFRVLLAALGLVLLLLPGTGARVPYAAEATLAGDCGLGRDAAGTFADAEPMPGSFACVVRLSPASGDAVDAFRFPAREGEEITFWTWHDPPFPDTRVRIDRPDGTSALSYARGGPELYRGDTYTVLATQTGEWRISLAALRETGVELRVAAHDPLPQDDCGSGRDAGGLTPFARPTGDPVPLTVPAACTGSFPLESRDRFDRYTFPVDAGTLVEVAVGTTAWNLQLCVTAVGGDTCEIAWAEGGGGSLRGPVAESGTWELAVRAWNDDPSADGLYTIALGATAGPTAPEDDCGSGADAGDDFASATPLAAPPVGCVGEFRPFTGDRADWYALEAELGDVIAARIETEDRDEPSVYLVSPSGREDAVLRYGTATATQGCEHASSATAKGCRAETRVADEAGPWRVRVVHGGGAAYRLTVERAPG